MTGSLFDPDVVYDSVNDRFVLYEGVHGGTNGVTQVTGKFEQVGITDFCLENLTFTPAHC